MVEKLPACGLIPLVWLTSPDHRDRAHAEAKVLPARVHRNRPAGRAGGGDRAVGRDRRPRFGAVLQFPGFWRSAAAAGAAATTQQWRWRLVRRRLLSTLPAAATTASATSGFLQGTAAGQARHHP